MESQCEFLMYFPAAPMSNLSDAAEYTTLPRRKNVYLGETVQFLLVLRSRGRDDSSGTLPWKDLADSLCALASVCVAESGLQTPGEQLDLLSSCSEDSEEVKPGEGEPRTTEKRGRRLGASHIFRPCNPLLSDKCSTSGEIHHGSVQAKSALVLEDQLIFCLTVSLDKLPVSTHKAKIVVTVWKQEEERAELREHGYLTLLQLRSPTYCFRQDLSTFKTQVSTTLDVLPPPSVQCRQMTVSGKHLTVLKVLNCSSEDRMCVKDVKILPNYNSSYLPVMPDGSVLIVDNVCHQSAEVTMASFCRIDNKSSHLPCTLSALEEQTFLFQLQLQDKAEEESSEGLEVPLLAVLQWHSPALPVMRCICTCYSLPSVHLNRPRLVMTASCPRTVRPLQHFWVKYTLLNNLHDFLAVRLIWNSEGGSEQDPTVGAVVCQSPLNNLGQCKKGSTLSFTVAFQILKTGLFELSQHMKLNLQFTAPVPTHPVEPQSPLKNTCEGHSLTQCQSFSHYQPSRSGAAMEFRAITSPAGSVGRAPCLYPDHSLISLEKIAKRECKVLVVEPIKGAHKR
ncbi:microtubule-associated protein 11-like isoform X1 [Archocentrus centrarchus]|uniref:microtubule-associated protein 11-like isoform X1 n=1 Tax=Archocentrus centrarchus TaxID=63155 RepID=UPI0011EA0166|nr:microtubule-associated protein 11-like isoform X1 [Archocentrus centrarchus]